MTVFAPKLGILRTLPLGVIVVVRLAIRENATMPVTRGEEGENAVVVFLAGDVRFRTREVAATAVPFCCELVGIGRKQGKCGLGELVCGCGCGCCNLHYRPYPLATITHAASPHTPAARDGNRNRE